MSGIPHPRLRGVSHHVAFLASLIAGTWLVAHAEGAVPNAAALVFGIGLSLCLGTSAAYHRGRWAPRARATMQKLDHSMIFVAVASTSTPVCLLALDGAWATVLLIATWTAAIGGLLMRLLWTNMPRYALVLAYVGVSLVGAGFLPIVRGELTEFSFNLIILGGALYMVGALIYLFRRPNPFPSFFGFHEVFHVLVIAAAACHYAAVYPLVATAA